MSRCVLGIFAKAALPGKVKTRLAEGTSAEFAARLAEAFLLDAIERHRAVAEKRLLVFSPLESERWFQGLAAGGYRLEAQGEGDLGERLSSFFGRHLVREGTKVVVVGTDSPNLPVAWVRRAFALLDEKEVVLGPAVDGGYYLIGLRGNCEAVFEVQGWGGPTVLRQTLDRVRQAGRALALLPPWYDVDRVDDARFLWEHMRGQRLAGEETGAERTEEVLAGWFGESLPSSGTAPKPPQSPTG